MKIWRPRFSIRTLAIFVTLVCILVAGWNGAIKASKESVNMMWRISDSQSAYVTEASAPAPFLIARNECEEKIIEPEKDDQGKETAVYRRYYLWLFGPKVKLPFDTQLSHKVRLPGSTGSTLRDSFEFMLLRGARVIGNGYRVEFPDPRTRAAVDDELVGRIAAFSHVKELDLSSTPITDASIASIAKNRGLKKVNLTNTNFTQDGVQKLRDSLPNCQITWSISK